MTYSHMGNPTLPSALRGFTSEFGKGSGGSLLLWSPAQLVCLLAMVLFTLLALRLPSFLQIECINRCIWVVVVCSISLTKSRLRLIVRSIWNRLILTSFEVRTTTVWVLYSQASRAISIGQLHASLHFHIQPINVVVFNGSSGDIKSRGNLILR